MRRDEVEADLVNVALIGKLDHDLQLFHLDVKWVIVLAEKNLHNRQCQRSRIHFEYLFLANLIP